MTKERDFDKAKSFTDLLGKNKTDDKKLQSEIDDLCERIHEMSKHFDDAGDFTRNFMTSELYPRYTNALSGMIEKNNSLLGELDRSEKETREIVETREKPEPKEKKQSEDKKPEAVTTVHDYLAPYRNVYEKLKDAPYRSEAKKAYEKLLDVEKETKDTAEAQCLIEKDSLAFNAIKSDWAQIYQTVINGSDPLGDASYRKNKRRLKMWQNAGSENEALYLRAENEREDEISSNIYTEKMISAQKLANAIASYYENKLDVLEWQSDITAQNGLRDMIADRRRVKRICEEMRSKLGLGFEELASDEKMKIWMLSPSPCDETGKIKTCLPPENIEAMRAILKEILSDKLISEILTEGKLYDYRFLQVPSDETARLIKEKCDELDADNVYCRNKQEIDELLIKDI